jgi:hypothetical protein
MPDAGKFLSVLNILTNIVIGKIFENFRIFYEFVTKIYKEFSNNLNPSTQPIFINFEFIGFIE